MNEIHRTTARCRQNDPEAARQSSVSVGRRPGSVLVLVQHRPQAWSPPLNGGEDVLDVRAAYAKDVANPLAFDALGNEVSDDHGWSPCSNACIEHANFIVRDRRFELPEVAPCEEGRWRRVTREMRVATQKMRGKDPEFAC
jgi:hypothetical protein